MHITIIEALKRSEFQQANEIHDKEEQTKLVPSLPSRRQEKVQIRTKSTITSKQRQKRSRQIIINTRQVPRFFETS